MRFLGDDESDNGRRIEFLHTIGAGLEVCTTFQIYDLRL